MFGKLSLSAIPFNEPIIMGTLVMVCLGGAALLGWVTYQRKWGYLWSEWFTTVDHKRIGVMYIIMALVMLLRGFADAIMMRAQQAVASADSAGYLPPHHYDQIFTAHGDIMIFFMAMPFITGLMNLVVPLQIGARDVAYPFLNSLSYWLTAGGVVLIMMSMFVGDFAATGWLAYPPLSELKFSPTVGVDYYIWALQLSGLGTTLSGINFIVTILRMRTPGMTLMKMPVFTWTALVTNILILPCFGAFSEIVATFSGKPLFGYKSMVYATAGIGVLSFVVWLHHFFTMGSGADVNAFFGISTMIISVPTGVKLFNWLFTMYRGRIRFSVPMLWTVGFMVTFTIGGMTGVLMAVPGADFVLHNSLFLIAHFHNVIIGGVMFGCLAAMNYWFPKAFGFKLDERFGRYSFWCWLVGFYLAFMPLYALGLMGMTRRMNHYDNPAWQPYLIVAFAGAGVIALGIGFTILQLIVSVRNRAENRDLTGDPWGGRTLEWSTSSPAPFYNFAVLPQVDELDQFWADKEHKRAYKRQEHYADIHMPRNTGIGVFMAAFGTVLGFAMVWHIWWLASLGLIGMVGSFLVRAYDTNIDYYVSGAEVEKIERARLIPQPGIDHVDPAKAGQKVA